LTGNPIYGEKLDDKFVETLNPKKKVETKFFPLIKTNEKGEATYNGVTLESSKGVLRAQTLVNTHIA
jgi:hypothetical protein